MNSKAAIKGSASNQTYGVTLASSITTANADAFIVYSDTSSAYARFISIAGATNADWDADAGWSPSSTDDVAGFRNSYRNYGGATIACNAGVVKATYSYTSSDAEYITDGTNTQSNTGRGHSNLNATKAMIGSDGTGSANASDGYWCEGVLTSALQSVPATTRVDQETYWNA